MAARDTGKLGAISRETGAATFTADTSREKDVESLFENVAKQLGEPDFVIFNASGRLRGPVAELNPEQVQQEIMVSAFGGFLVVQQSARRMLPRRRGAIFLTGATASVKGFAHSAAFAMGKFALRGLAQSAARELGPKGIHVAHFVIDGSVRNERNRSSSESTDGTLDPDAIAKTYLDVLSQDRSAWSLEVEVRPWVENF